ncbi:LamG domain-containing protein [Streptomyces sp. NPDC002888]|uniref:LamG domain-containing protein n=1 Tax=Streptomyces sp. NPDC002888 TaxID=3364668 RepID=UPI0036CD1155
MRRRTATTAAVALAAAGLVATTLAGLPTDSTDAVDVRSQAAAAAATPAALREAVASGLPTEAEAQTAAQEAGQSVEVTGLREERRTVLANSDGSFTAKEFAEPVRTLRGGRWADIDESLVQRADGSWAPKATTADVTFSGGGDGPFARVRVAGRELALSWPGGKLPKPVVNGDSATYENVLPDVDLVVQAEPDGFGHLVVVNTPEAARNPDLARLDLGVDTTSLTLQETSSGALRALDSDSKGVVLEAGSPVMWDAGDQQDAPATTVRPAALAGAATAASDLEPPQDAATAPVDLEVGQDKLTLIPSQDLLTDPDTSFPVVIDPIEKTTSRTAWTSVMKGMPNEQDWKFSGSAGMGKCPIDYNPIACNGVDVRRLMYTVPTSFYKGKDILEATFAVRVAHIYSATPEDEPVRLYRVGGKNFGINSSTDWGNTDTAWDSHIMTVDKAISPVSCSSAPNLRFESGRSGALTQEVQSAATGGWTQMTFGLRAADEGDLHEWKRICGNAVLEVTYNRPPAKVSMKEMWTSPGGVCATSTGAVRSQHVDELPKLLVIPRDPDHSKDEAEPVKVRFRVEWTDKNGNAQKYEKDTGYSSPTGAKFEHKIKVPKGKPAIPENGKVYWSAAVHDKVTWGPWSYEGDSAVRCEFVLDRNVPGKPDVDSKDFPEDKSGELGVGETGTFTFSPNLGDKFDNDVTRYSYDFTRDTAGPKNISPSSPTAPVSVPHTPGEIGTVVLEVTSYDKANNPSAPAVYSFVVKEGKSVAGQWNLGDDPLASEEGRHVKDESDNSRAARVGTAVAFTTKDGPGGTADRAAHLDGTADAYLTTDAPVVDTAKGFSVSAWVRPTALDKDGVVVSQDGTGEPGFTLGYDAVGKNWSFGVPANDVESLGEWRATATSTATCKDSTTKPVCPNEWVHLTGTYDPAAGQLQLYVNGELKKSTARQSTWSARGALQIGRAVTKAGYTRNFTGDIAEVRVFDRLTPAAEVKSMLTVKPSRKGYWPLDTVTSGASPDTVGGRALTLGGGATLFQQTPEQVAEGPYPLVTSMGEQGAVPGGHLVLAGNGYAATSSAPVGADGSFTVAARVRVAAESATTDQTLFALAGGKTNRFLVRYTKYTDENPYGHWELVVPGSDDPAAATLTIPDDQAGDPTLDGGQHIAVVYDGLTKRLRLYVDGQLADAENAGKHRIGYWAATGGLQVGRAKSGTGWANYLGGEVDDVRVYAGAADAVAVGWMAERLAQPTL